MKLLRKKDGKFKKGINNWGENNGNWKGGISSKSPYERLKLRRQRIKEKYGFGSGSLWRYGLKILIPLYQKYNSCCTVCFSKNDLTIHHIDGKGRNYIERGLKPNNSLENLLLLCRHCHGFIDGKKNKGGRN